MNQLFHGVNVKTTEVKNHLFHGSNVRVNELVPMNNHGDPGISDGIFASPKRTFALAYAGGRWDDRYINQSYINDKAILREMYPGAASCFDCTGYLYKVPSNTFLPIDDRGMAYELFSSIPVRPIEVTKIHVMEELLKAGVSIKRYNPYSKGMKICIERQITRAKTMIDREQYINWRLSKATPEVKELISRTLCS